MRSDDLSKLVESVDKLATYLYLTNVHKETSYRSSRSEPTAEEKYCPLVQFATSLNRIQVDWGKKVAITDKIADAASRLTAGVEVRVFVVVGLLAGVVMILGSVIFNIAAATAFLAWFAVVFGSVTIAAGMSAIFGRK